MYMRKSYDHTKTQGVLCFKISNTAYADFEFLIPTEKTLAYSVNSESIQVQHQGKGCDYTMAKAEVYQLGDVNKNGEIDSRDYVQLKRAYFKTAKLDETATLLADINNNGEVDSRDYVTLKRVYFKTAKIADDLKYVYAK